MKKPLNKIITTPIAHRGLHKGKIEENSMGAFSTAADKGLAMELDIHLMNDGHLVVHHDENIYRLTGHDISLTKISASDLSKYPLTISKEIIPTLDEVLKMIAGRVTVIIELKVDGDFDPKFPLALLKTLEGYPYPDKIVLQSFNPYAIRWLIDNQNLYNAGQLSSGKLTHKKAWVRFMFKTLLINRISHPDFVAFDITTMPSFFVKRLRRKGMPIMTWTIDSEEKLAKAKQNSDFFIFEKIKPF